MGKHPDADCDNCPLNEIGRFVPSLIPENPRLVVVGEAPGFHEQVRGVPFTGPSGKLLDEVLKHYGYSRKEVAYTNTVLCRAPNNATPSAAALRACRGRLHGEILGTGCKDIVALGGTAAGALVDDPRGITSTRVGPPKLPIPALRGRDGVRVIPTWHPAYCLRNADAFPTMVDDIGKLANPTLPEWSEPDWKYFDEGPLAVQALEALIEWQDINQQYELGFDIECAIEKDVSFDHPNNYDLLCIGFAYTKKKVIVIGETALKDKEVRRLTYELLKRSKLFAHNGKFDLSGLYPVFKGLELWFDTMLAHYALDERPGHHSLEALSIELLGSPNWKYEIKRYIPSGGNYGDVPRPVLYKYNALDCSNMWDLKDIFVQQLEETGQRKIHDFLVQASNQLMFLELNGITIDKEYNAELMESYLEKLDAIEGTIVESVRQATGDEIRALNPRSPKQIMAFFQTQGKVFKSCGVALEKITTTDSDMLESLAEYVPAESSLGRFIAALREYRYEHKRYGTYVKGIRKRLYRGRVYTTYLLHGSTSGRLASRNPNLQNIVRDAPIRRQFTVSKPGNIFIQGDYKQAEGRVICWLAQDEYLRSIFCNPDVDIFNELSDSLYGAGNWRKEVERVRTKAFFYGIGYGREPHSIAVEFGMSDRDATNRYNAFMDLIPATAAWQQRTREQVLKDQELRTIFGRRRSFFLITDQNRKDVLNEALSFVPQSTSSDICLSALVRLRPMLRGMGFIRLTIHDSITVECPEERADEVKVLLNTVMVEEAAKYIDYVPFAVDLAVGKTWGDFS